MVPVNEEQEVECPQCNQTFTEEILPTSARSNNSSSSQQTSQARSGPASPVLGASQPPQPQVRENAVAQQESDSFNELLG